jgi:hypothetical protein
MIRSTTARFWAVLIAGLVAYAGLGYWWSGQGNIEEWMYRIGLTTATLLPLVFTGIYSLRAKWWKNEIGTAIVLAALSIVPIAFPLAYVFWFDNGLLTASWLAWLEVSGPLLTTLALARMSWIWLRARRTP